MSLVNYGHGFGDISSMLGSDVVAASLCEYMVTT